MAKNIDRKEHRKRQLRLLAHALGIQTMSGGDPNQIRHGWQTQLAQKLELSGVNIINTWIARDIPKGVVVDIEKIHGIPSSKWFRDDITRVMLLHAAMTGDPDKNPYTSAKTPETKRVWDGVERREGKVERRGARIDWNGKERRKGKIQRRADRYEYEICSLMAEMRILDRRLFLQTAYEIKGRHQALLEFIDFAKKPDAAK